MLLIEDMEAIMGKARKPKKPERDEDREERIEMEIVVDAQDHEERAMGWFYYLEDTLHFPFLTRCISERPISPLQAGDEVEVVGMGPQDEYEKEMFVGIRQKQNRSLAVSCPSWRSSGEMKRRSRQSRTGTIG